METDGNNSEVQKQLRMLAEDMLRKRPSDMHRIAELSVMKIPELLHELRVHQIELEMQNEELRNTQSELRASRDRYADLYDFAPVAYFTVSQKGMIRRANLTGADMLGSERAHLLGRPFSAYITSGSQDVYYRHRRMVFESGTRQTCELKMKKSDGNEFHTRLESRIAEDEKGNPVCFRTTVSDITEIRQAQEALKTAEAKLHYDNKMRAIGTFTGGISHHFNNILSIIIGNTELAIGEISIRSTLNPFLEEIMTASLRAKEMVRQLLCFSVASPSERYPVSLESVAEDAVDLLRQILPQNISILQTFRNGSHTVVTDPPLIHLILINLAGNAAHAMEPDGGTISMDIRSQDISENDPLCLQSLCLHPLKPGRYVKITVSDSGHGMSPEIRHRIFEPYFTTKDVGKGTGLGLCIVHGIVHSHEGGICVNSEPGKGTEISVYLPEYEE